VSFASGSSYGTMAIMFPLVTPLAYYLAPNDKDILLSTLASVITGANFGDHCSPFSDLVILSALVSGIPHTRHVKTQITYAIVASVIGLIIGDIGTGLKLYPEYVALILGVLVLLFVVFFIGKRVGTYKVDREEEDIIADESCLLWRLFERICGGRFCFKQKQGFNPLE